MVDLSTAEIFNAPFMLVSYSHKDQVLVREDVNALIEKGARLWIDHRSEKEENMSCADNWRAKIEEALSHPNCVGALIYISGYSFAGKATRWEHDEIFKRPHLKPIAIYTSTIDTQAHIANALSLCNSNTDYKDDTYMLDMVNQVKRFNTKDIIGILRSSHEGAIKEIEKEVRALGVISDTLLTSKKINSASKSLKNTISLGIYKDTSRQCDEFPDDDSRSSRFRRGSCEYIHTDGSVFCTKPISWRFLYTKGDGTNVFIACEVLDTCRGNEIGKFIEEFKSLAFTEAQASLIGKLRVLTSEDVSQLPPDQRPELLALPEAQRTHSWWIQEIGLLDTWRCLYKNNKPYGLGFRITLKKGFRPVIEIGSRELESLL